MFLSRYFGFLLASDLLRSVLLCKANSLVGRFRGCPPPLLKKHNDLLQEGWRMQELCLPSSARCWEKKPLVFFGRPKHLLAQQQSIPEDICCCLSLNRYLLSYLENVDNHVVWARRAALISSQRGNYERNYLEQDAKSDAGSLACQLAEKEVFSPSGKPASLRSSYWQTSVTRRKAAWSAPEPESQHPS